MCLASDLPSILRAHHVVRASPLPTSPRSLERSRRLQPVPIRRSLERAFGRADPLRDGLLVAVSGFDRCSDGAAFGHDELQRQIHP